MVCAVLSVVMMLIKDPLLLTGKCSGGNRFPLSLIEWCFNICPMLYNHKMCSSVLLNKTFPLIGKSSPCGSSGFPLSLSEWSFTICMMPYNRKQNVLSASLNKTFPFFL